MRPPLQRTHRPDVVVIDVDSREGEEVAVRGELRARLPECLMLLMMASTTPELHAPHVHQRVVALPRGPSRPVLSISDEHRRAGSRNNSTVRHACGVRPSPWDREER
ncbi:hypothetical protein [Streptomyces coeruleorubidus]